MNNGIETIIRGTPGEIGMDLETDKRSERTKEDKEKEDKKIENTTVTEVIIKNKAGPDIHVQH